MRSLNRSSDIGFCVFCSLIPLESWCENSINQEKEPLKVNEYALNYSQMRKNEENLSLGKKLINSIFSAPFFILPPSFPQLCFHERESFHRSSSSSIASFGFYECNGVENAIERDANFVALEMTWKSGLRYTT